MNTRKRKSINKSLVPFKMAVFLLILLSLFSNFSPVQAKITNKIAKDKVKTKDIAATQNSPIESFDAILAKYKINPDHLSIQILDDADVVYAVNANEKKNPASISKLLTFFAVLKKLSLTHRFYTQLYSDGNNLYLRGGGDPTFVSENLWYMVNEFTRSGIKVIKGNIIVDDSLFDKVRFDRSRQDKRVDRAYDSPVGALSFNWNAVNIFVKPAKIGEKARVIIDPKSDYYALINDTITVSGAVKKELTASISNSEKIITVSGEVPMGAIEKAIYKSVAEPDLWAGTNLLYFLKQRDIRVEGKVLVGKTPEKAELVTRFESKNLSSILADMNKFSNNFVAEMLVKSMAAQEQKSGATLKRGVEMIREELAKIGIGGDEIFIANPSGLTRENSFSAASLNKVLVHIKKDFSIYPIFLEGLPVAGVDGTLKNRMKGTVAEGWVRAKTGSLDGVVTLAGYAGRRDGSVLSFSFLYNGPKDEFTVREAFDQLIINSLK